MTMGWIFVDKESGEGKGQMRDTMRTQMRRGGYRTYGGGSVNMRDHYEQGYREGYKHGWEDSEDENEENYRRGRDSRGRFM